MPTNITQEALDAAYVLTEHDWMVEEEFDCAACGEVLEVNQQAIDVYDDAFNIGRHRAVLTVHLRCYQGEEVRSG